MLKRQRPSSPISFPDEDATGVDIYEPDTKRRRYFAPPAFTQQRKETGYMSDNDSEDGEGVESGRKQYFNGKREWHIAAGVYKDANDLLHDLHAEQRHRSLFASPLPHPLPSGNSMDDSYLSSHPTQPLRFSKDHTRSHTDPSTEIRHRQLSGYFPGDEAQIGCDGERGNEETEAECVTQRYETSNRLLRALFLSRRKDIDGQHQT